MKKIVLIGAGSSVFGLGTVSDIFKSSSLEGSTIVLHDINSRNLSKTKEIAEKYKDTFNHNYKIEATTNRKEALKDVDAAGYDELMSVQDAEENMRFSIKESGGKIEELLMVVGGKKRFVLLSLYGEIDLKNISKIAKGINVGGLENLSKINEGN